MIMPKGPIYKPRLCAECDKPLEASRFSARVKYCRPCLRDVEKFWDKKKNVSFLTKFKRLKENALRRGIEITITYEEYVSVVSQNKCSYCEKSLPRKGSGVDRKHFSIGYVFGNCVPCCALCNDRKGKLETCGFSYERVLQLLSELND